MMEKLHGASNSIFLKLLLGFISLTFVISSMAGYVYTQTDTSAAKVNGEEISQRVFQAQYDNEIQRLSQQLGTQFAAVADTPEFTTNLRKQILTGLIDQTLLAQYVKDLKLDVSDEQIKKYIVTNPMFQTNGKFDNNLYLQLLQSNGLTAEGYAQSIREGLRLAQLQTSLAATAFIVPEQQTELAKLFFQQRQIRLATFPLADEIAKQQVSEQEIQAYYEANKAAFAVPELVKVQYIDLTGEALQKSIKVSDIEIAQYYQDNKSQFMTQRLSDIQVKSEQEAQDIYQQLQNGANFADLAKKYSIDPVSAPNGGDLSWVSAGEFPKVFEDAATALAVGQFSQPVLLDNSYHIILVQERKAQPLEQVKEQVAAQIRQNLGGNQFYSVEKQVAEKAFEDPASLNTAAQVAGVSVQDTGYFSRKDVPQALNYPNVISAIFDGDIAQGNVNSEPMNVGEQHSVVVRVLEHKQESTKSLAEAKAEIEQYLKQQKAQQVVLHNAGQLAQQLTESKVANVKFADAQTWIFAENKNPALNNVVFSMPKPEAGKVTYQAATAGNGDIVIIALDKVVDGSLNAQDLKQFAIQMEQMTQAQLQQDLLNTLRAKAKIEINDDFMENRETQ